jgi:hypothetical protein
VDGGFPGDSQGSSSVTLLFEGTTVTAYAPAEVPMLEWETGVRLDSRQGDSIGVCRKLFASLWFCYRSTRLTSLTVSSEAHAPAAPVVHGCTHSDHHKPRSDLQVVKSSAMTEPSIIAPVLVILLDLNDDIIRLPGLAGRTAHIRVTSEKWNRWWGSLGPWARG